MIVCFPKVGAVIRAGSLAVCVIAATGVATAEDSPFRPPGTQAAAPVAAVDAELDALQLSAISIIGESSMFNFVDPRNNRSFWVPLNGVENGVTVVSHDRKTDNVMIKRGAFSRTVQLRKATIGSMPHGPAPMAVAPLPQPVAPVQQSVGANQTIRTSDGSEIKNPKTPQEVAQAETEARMLVSDLLEISMQERARQKAIREAQQRGGQAAPVPQVSR